MRVCSISSGPCARRSERRFERHKGALQDVRCQSDPLEAAEKLHQSRVRGTEGHNDHDSDCGRRPLYGPLLSATFFDVALG